MRTSPPCRRIALFFHLLQPPFSSHFLAVTSFSTPGVTWCTLPHGPGEPRRRSFPPLNLHNTRARRKPGGHVQTDLSSARGTSCPILRFGENARPINQDPKNWNHTEQQRTCFVVSGRSTSSFTRQSKEGPNFSVAQLFRQLSKRLSVYISALAKCRKAFQKSRHPPSIPKLNGISKVL